MIAGAPNSVEEGGNEPLPANRRNILIDSSGKECVYAEGRACNVHCPLLRFVKGEARAKDRTYPGDNKLSSQVLHFRLDFAADVELVAVQGDTLQVGQQVLLAGRVRALGETDVTRQLMWTTGLW